jgi:hypothetical protein
MDATQQLAPHEPLRHGTPHPAYRRPILVESATSWARTPAEPVALLVDCTTALRLACIAIEKPGQSYLHAALADHREQIDRVLNTLEIAGLSWSWDPHGTAGAAYPVLRVVYDAGEKARGKGQEARGGTERRGDAESVDVVDGVDNMDTGEGT